MAKDDYFVIMYRILAYLYACLKKGADIDTDIISHKALNIPERYWLEIIENLITRGYIKGVTIVEVMNPAKNVIWDSPAITQDGVQFMHENSSMQRAYKTLMKFTDLIPGIF